MKNITTAAGLHSALALIFADTDFDQIGQVKDHMKETVEGDPSTKQPTGEVFLTAQLRMPQGSPLTIGGTDYYPNTLQVKIDGFKLSTEPGKVSSTPRAATANSEALRLKLNGHKPVPAAKAAAPAS